jgi:acyl-CoA synthetase (AMP-forming)/AMP-acid ligase II
MIVSGGENVYPEELEDVLMKNKLIECASVIGIPDIEFGQRLKAFVVLKEKSDLNEEIILKWLFNKVARYQMPAQIRIIDSLPMSSTGKIDKKELSHLE